MELVEFYKDGLLIRLDAPQTAFFTFKITSPDKLALLQDLRAYDANTILSARSYNKNSIQCQHTFFVTSFFKKWISKSFKDYLYIIVDNYSKTKAFKLPLKQFEHYKEIKKHYSSKTKAIEEEAHPKGFERSYFKKMIQNNTQWTMRATSIKLSKEGQKFGLRLSWQQTMESYLRVLTNYGFPFVGEAKDEWTKLYAEATGTEEARTKSAIRLGLTFLLMLVKKKLRNTLKNIPIPARKNHFQVT